jgi:hypothetical protein
MDDLIKISQDHSAEALAYALSTAETHPSDVMVECELVNILAKAFDAGRLAEREECASMAEYLANSQTPDSPGWIDCIAIAEGIRARC